MIRCMGGFLRKHSQAFVAFGLLLISCQLMSASLIHPELPRAGARLVEGILSPVQKTFREVQQSTRHVWERYVWLQGVEEERDQLLGRIKDLEKENITLQEFVHENNRLRRLLNFQAKHQLEGVAANIIGRDPSNWVRSVTIDSGERDGIRVGQAVVDGYAIVGQVVSVSLQSATVLLLTDNSSAVDAILQQSRTSGIVEGIGKDKLRLRYVVKGVEVHKGERIIASGLDQIYPKGALIGTVSQVLPGGGMFQQISVKPRAQFQRLETVFVVTGAHGDSSSGEVDDAHQVPKKVDASEVQKSSLAAAGKEIGKPERPMSTLEKEKNNSERDSKAHTKHGGAT